MAGKINKFLLDLAQYFRAVQNTDGSFHPDELNPFIQINYPFRDATGLWPVNIFNSRTVGVAGVTTVQATPNGPNGLIQNGPLKYWYVFGCSVATSDAIQRNAIIAVLPPASTTIPEQVVVESGVVGQTAGFGSGCFLKRPILVPPGAVLRTVVDALTPGAALG